MKKAKTSILIIIASITLLCCTVLAFGSVLFKSFVESEGTLTTGSIDKVVNINDSSENPVQVSASTQTVTFNKAGDSQTINVQVNNNIASVIEYKYEFAFDGDTFTLQTESFASCILVYYNDTFVDTLGNICANENNRVEKGYIDFSGYINKASNASSSIDTLKFELHSSSDKSIFDNDSSMSFKLRVYANTADYEHNMFVSTEDELLKAFNDLNYGTLPSDEKIVLFDNISLTKNITLNYPVAIDLNGYKLDVNSNLVFAGEGTSKIVSNKKLSVNSLTSTGSISVNNDKGFLDIEDFYSTDGINVGYLYSNISSATKYDSDVLDAILPARVKNRLRYGINAGQSINLLGGLSFYNLTVSTSSNLTYTNPNLVADSESYNEEESVTIGSNQYGVKIISSANDTILESLLENELLHLVNLSEEDENHNLIRTNAADLFLPTSIKSKNVSIEWVSSDESLISNTGIISSNINGDATLTIYAHITINDQVYTESFKIKTMSQNHETIFQYFVAQLSPIEMEEVFTGNNKNTAYYFLPIVDENYDPVNNSNYSGFDYRSTYSTPEGLDPGYVWEGFNNVGFEYITYTPISTYNFVSLDDNAMINGKTGVAVYLNSATFQNFAQVQVSAKFNGDEEEYSAPVNLIVKLGYNTELNELVFNKVSEDLNETNVLQNILNTRMEDGMKNEKGDFFLEGSYQTYLISYTIPESAKDAIKKIEGYSVTEAGEVDSLIGSITYGQSFTNAQIQNIGKYKICLNIEGFDTSDTNFGVNTVLSMPGTDKTASRILYFKCPGIIKNDETGFANMSVFNSVKYQVYKELCTITSEKGDSDVEDKDYTVSDNESFKVSGNLLTNYTGAYILRHDANQCTTLAFSLKESNTNTDNHIVYGLSKIIDWAVGTDSTTTFSTYFNGILDSSFISSNSSFTSYKSDGTANITANEKAVIKQFYVTNVGVSANSFETLWSNITEKQDYYVIYNSTTLDSDVSSYFGNSFSNGSSYSKYDEVFRWAHNDKDAENELYEGMPPCYGVIGAYDWNLDKTNIENFANGTLTLSATEQDDWTQSKYAVARYVENDSPTFSKEEMCVYIVMLLNSKVSSNGTNTTRVNQVKNIFLNHFTIPTYFKYTGIFDLVKQAYIDSNKTVSYDGFKSDISSFTIMGETFTVPHVTLMDWSTIGFDYFPNLKTLYVQGDVDGKLKAFHTEDALSTFFNRITSNNTNIENFAAEYCSNNLIDFSIKNISNLKKLKKISLYHNQGINNVGALLKLTLENLTYVDIADINLKNEYSEFVMKAINYKTNGGATVFYTPDGTSNHATYSEVLNSDAEGLIYLEEFYELLAENSNMTQNVYTENGSQAIQWKIEEGNGITLVSNTYENSGMNDLGYNLNPILIKYYLVTSSFRYGGYNFQANHLYWIYNDGNGNIVFEAVKDENENEIVVTIGNAPNALTEAQVNEYIANNNIQSSSEEYDNTDVSYGNFTNTSNTAPSGNRILKQRSASVETITINNYDGTTESLNLYGLGYITTTARRNITTTYDKLKTINYYNFEATLYYASLANSRYTINKATYTVEKYDSYEYDSSVITERETMYNFVYYYRNGNSYRRSLFEYFPKIISFVYNNVTYDLTNYGYSKTTISSEPDSGNYGNSLTANRSTNTTYYTAIPFNQTVYETIETALERKYIFANSNAFTWYDAGTQKTQVALAYGGHTITLNTRSNGGGFTYSAVLAEKGDEILAYKASLTMRDILNEANTHLTDSKFGLYYHNYYAFPGTYSVSYKLSDFVADFRAYGIYYLEIGSDGKFYWEQDSNPNSQYYTIISGTYIDLFNSVAELSASDLGKIIYYNGTASQGNIVGTNIFYQVEYNSGSGAYTYNRFGALGSRYVLCDGNGDFASNNWANSTYGTPSDNADGFKVLCNQVRYLDSNFFVNNSTTTTYSYCIGGTRQAVFTAMITVNDVQYERKFVINVIG